MMALGGSLFAGSTWIVQKGDRDPILAPRPAEQMTNAGGVWLDCA
jgi:hypothetical protein